MNAFRPAIYNEVGLYDTLLPPYLIQDGDDLVPDDILLARTMQAAYGDPSGQLDVLEIGAGTGRMTEVLAPYAGRLVCTEKNDGMLSVLQQKVPKAETIEVNTNDLAEALVPARQFDYVGAYWTLSYPIGEKLETIDGDRIISRPDFEAGVEEATTVVASLTNYLKSGGRLDVYFFDSESPEQQAVTRIWEQLAPDPGGYRGFTRDLARHALREAADRAVYTYDETHRTGIAPFDSAAAMTEWYAVTHCKGLESLTGSDVFAAETERLAAAYRQADGSIALPIGMYELNVRA